MNGQSFIVDVDDDPPHVAFMLNVYINDHHFQIFHKNGEMFIRSANMSEQELVITPEVANVIRVSAK